MTTLNKRHSLLFKEATGMEGEGPKVGRDLKSGGEPCLVINSPERLPEQVMQELSD